MAGLEILSTSTRAIVVSSELGGQNLEESSDHSRRLYPNMQIAASQNTLLAQALVFFLHHVSNPVFSEVLHPMLRTLAWISEGL